MRDPRRVLSLCVILLLIVISGPPAADAQSRNALEAKDTSRGSTNPNIVPSTLLLSSPTWGPEERVSNTSTYSTVPDVATDPSGQVHVVWADGVAGGSNWSIRYSSRQTTWLPDVDVSGSGGSSNGSPSIAFDSFGRAHVVWMYINAPSDETIRYRMNDGAWGPVTTIHAPGGAFRNWARGPEIEVDGNDVLHVVFWQQIDASSSSDIGHKTFDGSWSTADIVSTGPFRYFPVLAIDRANNLHLAWWGDASVFEVFYQKKTTAWGPALRLSDEPDESGYAAIAVDDAGRVHVLWQDSQHVADEIYYRRYNGAVWETPILLSPDDGLASQWPTVAVDDVNRVHVVWSDARHGSTELYYRMWDGSWTDEVRLTNAIGNSQNPNLFADSDVHLAWTDERDGNFEIYYRKATPPQTSLRLNARVRPLHKGDDFLPAPVPVAGATVTLDIDGNTIGEVETDTNGIARFNASPSANGTYTIRLEGPHYRVKVFERSGNRVATQTVTMNPIATETIFQWPSGDAIEEGPAAQVVYYLEQFRTEYLLDRLGYTWRFPTLYDPGATKNNMYMELYDYPNCKALGGACATARQIELEWEKAFEADVVYHEYMHPVVYDRFEYLVPTLTEARAIGLAEKTEGVAMDEALADYFAASFTNDPKIDDCHDETCHCPIFHFCCPRCHERSDISKKMSYPSSGYAYDAHKGSRILSSALWYLRGLIDGEGTEIATTTDALVFMALDEMIIAKNDPAGEYYFIDFYNALKAVDQVNGPTYAQHIDDAFERSKIINNPGFWVPSFVNDDAITRVDWVPEGLSLEWVSAPGAVGYEVNVIPTSYTSSALGMGGYVAVDTVYGDTTYVYYYPDADTEYLIALAPVGIEGQPGYLSSPVFIPRQQRRSHYRPKDEPPGPAATGTPAEPVVATTQYQNRLLFNSPNPFNPETQIVFESQSAQRIELTVFDVSGKRIRSLVTGEDFPAGVHRITWDGRNDLGRRVASGPYFVAIQGDGWQETTKVILLK